MPIYLAKYRPLQSTHRGAAVAARLGIPAYVDSSCRREPDLESDFPSISAVCRAGLFAPKLRESDIVLYVTVKEKYDGLPKHRRLVAILQVIKRCHSHSVAADWYAARNLPVPSNCMVAGNPPKPLAETCGCPGQCGHGAAGLEAWDNLYRERTDKWPWFLICKAAWLDLLSGRKVTDEVADEIVGRRRIRQRLPIRLSPGEYRKFRKLVG
jgi:hypothetical protein